MTKKLSITSIMPALAAGMCAAVLAVALSATTAFASENVSGKYKDVAQGAWYTEYIQWAQDEGIITGYGNGYFGVGDTITRADFVTILWRYYEPDAYATYNEAAAQNTSGMSDVESGKYYTEAVNWAVSNGIVTGYGNGQFGPYDNITREQMVTIYYRFLNLRGADVSANSAMLNTFPDAAGVSDFAYDAVCWATTHGVITGAQHNGISYVDATSATLREQACKIAEGATSHDTNNIWKSSSTSVYVPNYVAYYQCSCGFSTADSDENGAHVKALNNTGLSGNAYYERLWQCGEKDVVEKDEGSYQTVTSGNTCRICGAGMTANNTCYHDYQAVYEDIYVPCYMHTYICAGCGQEFSGAEYLTVHKKLIVNGLIDAHATNSTFREVDTGSYQNVITHYTCSKCGDSFEVSTPQGDHYGCNWC